MSRNVVLLMVDQLNHRCLGYAGHPVVRTPNIDLLRQDSVNFTCCYVQNGYCLPSRTSYLSGQYLHTHRQYGFTGLVPENTPSMGAYFTERGYRTAFVGKAHVNSFGERFGFGEFVPTLPEDMYRATDPAVNYLAYCRDHGLAYPTDQVHGDAKQPAGSYGVSGVPEEHSQERYTANESIRIIESHRGSTAGPLFLTVSFDRPHPPLTPSPEYARLYDPKEIPLPAQWSEAQLQRKPSYIRRFAESGNSMQSLGEDEFRRKLSMYYALITHVDAEIGRVVDTLKSAGLYEDTVIAFCSDHGDLAGYAGLTNKYSNRCYYDHIVRTPMLIKLPRQEMAGNAVSAPVEAIDLFPTFCALTDDSTTPPQGLDGKNLYEYAVDQSRATERHGLTAFSESYSIKMIRDGRYKLIYTVATGERELYDMDEDPEEANNLYHLSEYRDVVRSLKAKLLKKLTIEPSPRRADYIERLFKRGPVEELGAMDKLAKWRDGIVDGGGFWMNAEDPYRYSVFPYRGVTMLEREDRSKRETTDHRHFEAVTDPTVEDRLLDGIIDYLCRTIRPVSVMMELKRPDRLT